MKLIRLCQLPLASASLLVCMSANADYQSPDGAFHLSGFGTLGLSRSSTESALKNPQVVDLQCDFG
jgi:hypothetical protein